MKPKGHRVIYTSLPDHNYDRLTHWAAEADMSVAQFTRVLITKYLRIKQEKEERE